jgi:hypothetical protein
MNVQYADNGIRFQVVTIPSARRDRDDFEVKADPKIFTPRDRRKYGLAQIESATRVGKLREEERHRTALLPPSRTHRGADGQEDALQMALRFL